MPKDAKDKGYIRQLFSLCLFQVHLDSHKGQNNNDTKKEKEKNVTAAAGELWLDSVVVKGVSIQPDLVVVDHLLNVGSEFDFRKGRFLFFLVKGSLDHIKFQGFCSF